MENNEGVAAYITRVQTLVNQMKNCGKKVSDKSIIEKILRTLTPRFDVIAVSLEETRDLTKMRLEELQGSLEAYEQRINERGRGKDHEQALQARAFHKNEGESSKFKKGKKGGEQTRANGRKIRRKRALIKRTKSRKTKVEPRGKVRRKDLTKARFSATTVTNMGILLMNAT